MHKLLKPACLLLLFLFFINFFIVGTTFAMLIDVAKDQGLAGSAIILGYGVLFGFFAVVISFFLIFFLPLKSIVKINRFFSILLLMLILVFTIQYITRKKSNSIESQNNHNSELVQNVNRSVF